MKRKKEQVNFSYLLKDKRVPIVILDERWHELFRKQPKNTRVIELEKTLGNLMKKQGKLITDVKDLKSAKHQLMDGIVANMNVSSSESGLKNGKKLQKSQKLIIDINNRLKTTDNDLADIPYQIKEANENLVVEGMNLCYQRMADNSVQLDEMNEKINRMREELKQLVAKKQDMEDENNAIYTYMHDVLGSDIMETLDQHYHKK